MLFQSINLAIVDDHPLFRKTLGSFLSEQNNMSIAFQESTVGDAMERLKTTSVDLLLMDLFLPGLHGDEAVKQIRQSYPWIKVLILSMSRDVDLISTLLDLGIHGYISKSDEPEELLQAIRAVAENRIYRNQHLTEALYRNKQNTIHTYSESAHVRFSEREKKVLQLIWEEKSSKEMADELFLGVRSVEKIRQDMKEKIGAKSTVGLLKYAISKRLIGTGAV
ncbi:MAG: response regulator transcription factor [Bacteroidetes bacterium]|nr:response regulator transcription factor [Bacteroidota bacterium]